LDRLDAIRLFVRVVESGSFSAVARERGIGQPAVSKQIAALETHLGVQLIRRTSRSMTLTDDGQSFYETIVRVVDDFDAAESLVRRGQSTPSGVLRVTVPPLFGRLCVVPRLPEFFALFPDISIELSVSERAVNLVEDGIDLAIRLGALSDSSMIVRKIATTPLVLVATRAYLDKHGVPQSPQDLNHHACVTFTLRGEVMPWTFQSKSGLVSHHPNGSFRTPDAENIRAAVLCGLGLAAAPRYLFASEIASGVVGVVMPDYQLGALAISAIHPAGRRLPAKVRVFIDFLAGCFAQDPRLAQRWAGDAD
jgi:DNA-binding transcriptional LysR family regulator